MIWHFTRYDLSAFQLGVNTLQDLRWYPVAVPWYLSSHWFKPVIKPHSSFGLSLGSATSKIFLLNLPLILLKKKKIGIRIQFQLLRRAGQMAAVFEDSGKMVPGDFSNPHNRVSRCAL